MTDAERASLSDNHRMALEESRLTIEQQRDDLEKLRGRASSVLQAGGLAATFFGALTLRGDNPLTIWTYLAAIDIAALVAAVVIIHWPINVTFTNDARVLLGEEWDLDARAPDEAASYVAGYNMANFATNQPKIVRLTWVYVCCLGVFALEVILLGADLAFRR